MNPFFFWLMTATLLTHELDAVRRHEWRVFPYLRTFPDSMAAHIFVWLHIPLFMLVLWALWQGATAHIAIGLSVFAILHVGLHWVFRHHPAYEFNNPGSWALILLPGLFAVLHLATIAI